METVTDTGVDLTEPKAACQAVSSAWVAVVQHQPLAPPEFSEAERSTPDGPDTAGGQPAIH